MERNPAIQDFLDELAKSVKPDPDQSLKHSKCPHEAGSIACLDETWLLCQACAWWEKINK